MKYLLIGFLRAYRLLISPLYGQVCRYHPSCSAYALESVTVYGAMKGSWLTAKRLGRCHPWAAGGYDPVPGDHDKTPFLLTPTTPAPISGLDPTEPMQGTA